MSLYKTERQQMVAPMNVAGVVARPRGDLSEEIRLYNSGDLYFESLLAEIAAAKRSIKLEFYIFAFDRLGLKILVALADAARRGVSVRLLVDGVGSNLWIPSLTKVCERLGINFKVYSRSPFSVLWRVLFFKRGSSRQRAFRRLNRRNHRKVCIVDSTVAFVGSMNVVECHSAAIVGEELAWRDSGVRIVGDGVALLEASFEGLWRRPRGALFKKGERIMLSADGSRGVRLNLRRADRRENYLDLLVRILSAREKIWIESAYFVPDGSLVRALGAAAQSGVDVRIVVPANSDVFFLPWVTSAFHVGLLRVGIKVFEYGKGMLHAKMILIDNWGLVGSSNLNHRSLFHDLEADVAFMDLQALAELRQQVSRDIELSTEITLNNWFKRPWIQRVLGRAMLWARWVL